MPLKSYGVLTAQVMEGVREGVADSTPHYQVHLVDDAEVHYRVAVNVKSASSPSELLYLAVEDYRHPITALLRSLPSGWTSLPPVPGGANLDYIRANLFDRTAMRILPVDLPDVDNDLPDMIDHHVRRAMLDPTARVHVFGERWGPEANKPDKIFGFRPGNGVHDIHMNQGNDRRFAGDDGVWQDGGMVIHHPAQDQWVAIFLAFQSQQWHTDDATGHAIGAPVAPARPPAGPATPVAHPETPVADGRIRVVAALVNPTGPAPEAETVTLLNTTALPIDVGGWSIVDRMKNRMPLDPATIPAGETLRIMLHAPVQLGNSGGLISLLDPNGLKVDGVAYTAGRASQEGLTVAF